MAASHGAAVLTVRPRSWALRLVGCAFVVYFAYALSHLELTPARFMAGLEHGQKFLSKLFPPDFHRWELLVKGLKESLQIAILASVLGIPRGTVESRLHRARSDLREKLKSYA